MKKILKDLLLIILSFIVLSIVWNALGEQDKKDRAYCISQGYPEYACID